MATVEKSGSVRNVAEASRRVLDPLRRLRGYIRAYVTLEAAAIVVLYLLACFWVSFAFDYGAFKMPYAHIDWVQELPWLMRVFITLGLVSGVFIIIAAKALNRLLARFRDATLALELERRFPKILGDRLITAVEDSNRRKVLEQGYSTAMVDETIVEAAERVEKLPIKDVFRWSRLIRMAVLIFVLSVVMYFVVGGVFCAVDSIVARTPTSAGFGDFHEAAVIWFERNVLLQDTIWPRKSYLVFIEPVEENLRIGRNVQPPTVHVRAFKYVLAVPGTREGWRGLQWSDLEHHKDIIFGADPAEPPVGWKMRDSNAGLTVDEVDLMFTKFDIRKGTPGQEKDKVKQYVAAGKELPFQWSIGDPTTPGGRRELKWSDLNAENVGGITVPKLSTKELTARGWPAPKDPDGYSLDEVFEEMDKPANQNNPDFGDHRIILHHLERLDGMRQTLDKVNERIAENNMRRTLQKLVIPDSVSVTVSGPTTNNTMTLNRADHEFTGQFGDLKEKTTGIWNFYYRAVGEDYYTQYRYLTIVPPPTLTKLDREDSRPAYLFYRPRDQWGVTAADLKGKKQPIVRTDVSLMGGDVVPIDLPAGTDLTLIGESDKDLVSVKLVQAKGGAQVGQTINVKGRTFTMTFIDVRQDQFYEIRLLDTDNVEGSRKIRLRPIPDAAPDVNVSVADWLRKTKDGIMITPRAHIPFSGDIKDDNGLAKVQYAYTVSKVESTAVLDVVALYSSGVMPLAAAPTGAVLNATTFLVPALNRYEEIKNAGAGGARTASYFPSEAESLKGFADALYAPRDKKGQPSEEFLPGEKVKALLAVPQSVGGRNLLREFKLIPDRMDPGVQPDPFVSDFEVEKLKLTTPEGKPQVRHRVMLWVEATDTDLDSTKARDGADGPKVGASKERYQLLIVDETDLLVEIAKDEAKQSTEMAGVYDKMQEIQAKLDTVKIDLGSGLNPAQLSPLSVRTEALDQTLASGQAATKEILQKYQGIFAELKGNQVQGNKLQTVAKDIIVPLDDIDTDFETAKSLFKKLRDDLDSKDDFATVKSRSLKSTDASYKQVQVLLDKIKSIMDKMAKEIELNEVIEGIRRIEQAEQRQYELVEQIKKNEEKRILDKALNPDKK